VRLKRDQSDTDSPASLLEPDSCTLRVVGAEARKCGPISEWSVCKCTTGIPGRIRLIATAGGGLLPNC
jgi:hypothetical protein